VIKNDNFSQTAHIFLKFEITTSAFDSV